MQTRKKGIQVTDGGDRIVNKQYRGKRIFARLGSISQDEAEAWLRSEQSRIDAEDKRTAEHLFCDAAGRYVLKCQAKKVRSLDDIVWHMKLLLPYVGALPLDVVHSGSFDKFKQQRIDVDGVSPTTVNRSLETARTVLIRSARVWRDDSGKPWLSSAPPIEMLKEDRRPARPISWSEQQALIAEQPEHLVKPILFSVNTGAREENVCGLRWEWERHIKELGRSVFVIPSTEFKSNRKHVLILNDVEQNVIDACRGVHPEYVFTYTDIKKGLGPERISRLNSHAYRKARKRAGLEGVRLHDLRHTYGQRLPDADVSEEDRAVLFGHSTLSMASHYATPTIKKMIDMANAVQSTRDTPTLLRIANG